MSFLISTAGIVCDCGELSQLNCFLFVCAGFICTARPLVVINTEQI